MLLKSCRGLPIGRPHERGQGLFLDGLLDVNMPMLYGGRRRFIAFSWRLSHVGSIFAWDCNRENVQPGSILADDPGFFNNCSTMKPIDQDENPFQQKNYVRSRKIALVYFPSRTAMSKFGLYSVAMIAPTPSFKSGSHTTSIHGHYQATRLKYPTLHCV